MGSAFSGLNTSVSGLFSARRNLDVINHNVGNASNPGYSRQYAVQEAAKPYPVFDGSGMAGKGSYITTIEQVRNKYIDMRYWQQNQVNGEAAIKEEMLMDIEGVFAEPSESSVAKVMDEFFNALHELDKEPANASVRSGALQSALAFTDTVNSVAANLEKLQVGINQNISSMVKEVNVLGGQIAKLNKQIFDFEMSGNVANDLRDKRTFLIDQLSQLTDISVEEVEKGTLPNGSADIRTVIRVGGNVFVDDNKFVEMELVPRAKKLNDEDIPDLFEVQWPNGDIVELKAGKLKGYIDSRDGNSAINDSPNFKGVPFYKRKLNEFVQTFAKAFNEGTDSSLGHASGYGISNEGDETLSGIRFFTPADSSGQGVDTKTFLDGAQDKEDVESMYNNLTAKNFSVSKDVLEDYSNISISTDPNFSGNSDVLKDLVSVRHDVSLFEEGAPEDFYRNVVSTNAVDLRHARRMSDNSETILTLLENRRLSESGVSIDEEMTNMVKQQQIYSASASLINTWSEIYDILINRTGLR